MADIVPELDLHQTNSAELPNIKDLFSGIFARPSFMGQVAIPQRQELEEQAQHYLYAHNKLFEMLPKKPIDEKSDITLRNLQTNFLFGSSEASELRLMFFGLKPAVLGGDRYEYRNYNLELVSQNIRGSFAIIRATGEYPNIKFAQYKEPGEGFVDGVAFDPKLEEQVLQIYNNIFQKLGYDTTKPATELIPEIFQKDDVIAESLALGYSLGDSIFFNLSDYPLPKGDRAVLLWENLDKLLNSDQMKAVKKLSTRLTQGVEYADFAKEVGLQTDHFSRFKQAWVDSGMAKVLNTSRKKFYEPDIYEHIKDMF